jgi:rhodanese-related sulfurtransferase
MAPDPASLRHDFAADVPRDELERRLLDPGLTLVDVLPRESFESGHIPGAISLPLSEIAARAREVLPGHSREVIVYCGGPT